MANFFVKIYSEMSWKLHQYDCPDNWITSNTTLDLMMFRGKSELII